MNENLVFKKNDVEYMKLCLHFTLYWSGSVFDQVESIQHFYRTILNIVGSKFNFYLTEQMDEYDVANSDALDLLPTWLKQPDRSREILTLSLKSSTHRDHPSDTAFEFWAVEYPENPAGMIQVMLPVNFIQESPENLVILARNLTGKMKFHSGHGGYAISWDKNMYGLTARKEMSVLSRRYPGIELPEPAATLMAIPYGIKRVNWITLVGSSLITDLTIDKEPLDTQLKKAGITTEKLPFGILIVAGKEPKTGDVNRQDDLESYYNVGRVLAGIRSAEYPPFLVTKKGFAEEEITDDWLSYFDS